MSKYTPLRVATGKKEQRLYRERFRFLCGDRKNMPSVFSKQQLGRVDAALKSLFGMLPNAIRAVKD